MNSFGSRFGALVKRRRGIEALTQEKLAVRAFGDQGNKARISELENGRVANPHQQTIDALTVALNLTEAEIEACRGPTVPPLPDGFVDTVGLTQELVEAVSWSFGFEHPAASVQQYQQFLVDKADELRRLQARIGTLGENTKRISNLLEAAQSEIHHGRFNEADTLLRLAEEMQQDEHTLRQVAKQAEIRATRGDAALLRGDSESAYEHFAAAARFFAPFSPTEGARLRQELSDRLYAFGLRYGGRGLEAAATLVRANLDVYTEREHPLDWALTQRRLARSLENRGGRIAGSEGDTLLFDAVAACEAALRIYSQANRTDDLISTLNVLGNTFMRLGFRSLGATSLHFLTRAADHFERGLSLCTPTKAPMVWARFMNNLANVLRLRGERTPGESGRRLLSRAVDIYEATLKVRTREANPLAWAMTQMNLGSARARLGERMPGPAGNKLLKLAVPPLEAALTVRTETDHPVAWGEVQWGLAVPLRLRGERTSGATGDSLIIKAISALENASRAFTGSEHSMHRAMVAQELGLAFGSLATRAITTSIRNDFLKRAIAAYDTALRGLDPTVDRERHEAWSNERQRLVDRS